MEVSSKCEKEAIRRDAFGNFTPSKLLSHCHTSLTATLLYSGTSPPSTVALLYNGTSPHNSVNFSYSPDSKWDRCSKMHGGRFRFFETFCVYRFFGATLPQMVSLTGALFLHKFGVVVSVDPCLCWSKSSRPYRDGIYDVISKKDFDMARWYVLSNCEEAEPFLQ
ncbi:hypothetical protein H5410_061992 [Solanum commersonii]|uniref:Uncharacterized protein n=1 Tax=Solanum commersonii TaxID=4109 RepID=A0A9J5W9J2_SOLCO|nr:hypothetical protein H5410_061992 [Solanum commersonii]